MASPSKDATPMWKIMSSEDDKALMEKFTAESNKVINRWFFGDASFTEKDAAVAFLVQLGAVQITIQSGSQQTSQKQVSILFGDGEDLKTIQEHRKADPGDTCTKDAIPSEGNPVTRVPDSSDQDAEKIKKVPVWLDQDTKKNSEALMNADDDDEDSNRSVWMTEPDDEDNVNNQIPNPSPVPSTILPRVEHPCPDCHTVLHSMWELDMHKLSSCTFIKTPQNHVHVYNCDQCSMSFVRNARAINHLCKVHNMSQTKAVEKLGDLKSTERQNKRKTSERRKRIVHKRRHKYSDENVDEPRQSKRLFVKLQPLANGWLKILESETVDTRTVTSDTLTKESYGTAPVSNDKRTDVIHTFGNDQNLKSKRENETSSPVSDCKPVGINKEREASESEPVQGDVNEKSLSTMAAFESNELEGHGCKCTSVQVQEKHKDNSITTSQEGPLTADGEKEPRAAVPMSQLQNSETEVEAKSGRKSSDLLNDEQQYQGGSDEQVRGENEDASTSHHMERNPEIKEIHEPIQGKDLGVTTEKGAKDVNRVGDDDNENGVTDQKPAKGKILTCTFCDLQFKSEYKRQKHVLKIHTEHVQVYKCSTCNKSFLKKSELKVHLKTHMDINDREKYCCKMCQKSFLIKFTYEKHMKSHIEKPETFKCDTCGKLLTTKRGLDIHVNCQHKKEIVYTCEVCGKNFYTTKYIKQHLETHTAQKTWKCKECRFVAFNKYRLRQHKQKVHTTRQYLICKICGSAFKTPSNLRQHHLTAHTNDYKFSCDVCGKKFKRSSHLNAHVKIHSNDPKNKPFECEICGKCFRIKNKLQVHLDWHNNVRSYTCHVCGKSFLTKGNLDKHHYIHLGKKPHVCRICSQGFTDMPGLRKHLNVKHQITLKKRVTEVGHNERVDKGSPGNLPAHKQVNRPFSPSTMVSDPKDRIGVADVNHLEISNDVVQLSETNNSQIAGEALRTMIND